MKSLFLVSTLFLGSCSCPTKNATYLLDGQWQIAQQPSNPLDVVNREYVDAVVGDLLSQVTSLQAQVAQLQEQLGNFNATGWVHTAHILGTSALTAATYQNGFGTRNVSDQEWVIPCAELANYSIMALVMGEVVDYFRPNSSLTPCAMLSSNVSHEWTNAAYLKQGRWFTPNFFPSPGYMGGSLTYWPKVAGIDNRAYLSFWGAALEMGGCCSTSPAIAVTAGGPSLSSIWSQAFDLFWQ